MPDRCPFCGPDSERIWMENAIGLVLWDAFPVTEGHTLVVPRKHVASIYELSPATGILPVAEFPETHGAEPCPAFCFPSSS